MPWMYHDFRAFSGSVSEMEQEATPERVKGWRGQ